MNPVFCCLFDFFPFYEMLSFMERRATSNDLWFVTGDYLMLPKALKKPILKMQCSLMPVKGWGQLVKALGSFHRGHICRNWPKTQREWEEGDQGWGTNLRTLRGEEVWRPLANTSQREENQGGRGKDYLWVQSKKIAPKFSSQKALRVLLEIDDHGMFSYASKSSSGKTLLSHGSLILWMSSAWWPSINVEFFSEDSCHQVWLILYLKKENGQKMASLCHKHKGEHVSKAAQYRIKALHGGWMTSTDDYPLSQHKDK